MSQESVEIVRAFTDCWDPWDLGPAFEFLSPQVEFHPAPTGLSAGHTIYGADALRRHWQELISAESEEEKGGVTIERIADLGDEVLTLEREVIIGRSTGIRTEALTGGIFNVEGGLIVRIRGFMSHKEALEAAGLSE